LLPKTPKPLKLVDQINCWKSINYFKMFSQNTKVRITTAKLLSHTGVSIRKNLMDSE